MLEFVFLKEVIVGIHGNHQANTQYFASSYQGGILLKSLTVFQNSVSENITNLPMCEVYQKEDGSHDIRMMNFALGQVGVDMGFDFGDDSGKTPPVPMPTKS